MSVHRLDLDRPDTANALSADLVERLLDALSDLRPDTTAVVVSGSARHFSAGFDLAGVEAATDGELVTRFLRIGVLLERLRALPVVTVAVVRGAAVGAGADLALACDHRIGTPSTRVAFPGAGFGVVLGTHRLAAVAGPTAALDLATSGRRVTAPEAHALGLLTAVVDDDQVDAAVARVVDAAARPDVPTLAALVAATGTPDPDPALAALARSLVVGPSLRDRVLSHVHHLSRTPKENR